MLIVCEKFNDLKDTLEKSDDSLVEISNFYENVKLVKKI